MGHYTDEIKPAECMKISAGHISDLGFNYKIHKYLYDSITKNNVDENEQMT